MTAYVSQELTTAPRSRSLTFVLELQCSCGWACRGETREALLEQVKAHVEDCPHLEAPLQEGLLRALIAERARPVEDAAAG